VPNLKFLIFSHFGAIIAFNAQKFKGSHDIGHDPFLKKLRVIMGLSLRACSPNLKFVSSTVLELLAFNAQQFKGSRDPSHAPFSKNFFRVITGLSLRAWMPNLKFVPSTVLELIAFNAPNFTGSRDPGHAPFYPLLTFGGWRRPSDIVSTMNHLVQRQRQRNVSTLPLKMHYVGAILGENGVKIGDALIGY